MVIERFGKYSKILTAGIHCIVPCVERPKKYSYRYFVSTPLGDTQIVAKNNMIRISTQNEVIDFPRQNVITRDNASVFLDAVLSFQIVNPVKMIYNCQNVPHVLSKLLQAQLRNVAGSLDIDQIIEESATLNILTGLMDSEASRWGIKIVFVKVQRVEAPGLNDVLAKKKNADLQNQEVIINAKAKKQSQVIESEGHRDSMIKRAEGEAQEMLARAKGQAQAIKNAANAEARSIKEIGRAITEDRGDPTRYLLTTKYLEDRKSVV